MRPLVLSFLSLFAALLIAACVKMPETGRSTLLLTCASQENQMGADAYQEVLKKEKINKDPRLNRILQRVGRNIAAQANRSKFKWQFTLIESKQLNAWCMPGEKLPFTQASYLTFKPKQAWPWSWAMKLPMLFSDIRASACPKVC